MALEFTGDAYTFTFLLVGFVNFGRRILFPSLRNTKCMQRTSKQRVPKSPHHNVQPADTVQGNNLYLLYALHTTHTRTL
jgi:hypothetical protein